MQEIPTSLTPVLTGFLGGLGLFLLGMTLMTDGFKLAGGTALKHILGRWTRTRWRGLVSGIGITALVQSSSAVTVATIGFANAGLLSLGQAIWVIFGANVGTTMTGWLVALLGFNIRIDAFALPAIGVGALVYLFAHRTRPKALGMALAGFGLLFLGIDVLKNAFGDLSAAVDLGALAQPGFSGQLIMVLLGALLTVLMQSSSASMAMALTATMGGVLPIESAAAAVIGANLGTTVKAMLVVIGATANAKRVAAAHVIFNLLTGAVALIILPWFLHAIAVAWGSTGEAPAPAVLLALFHTAFNILGVLLMIPVEPPMTRFLAARFRSHDEDEAQPRHLDRNSVSVPDIALRALVMELARIGGMAINAARDALATDHPPVEDIQRRREIVDGLVIASGEFASQVSRGSLPEKLGDAFIEAQRVAQYEDVVAEQALDVAQLRSLMERHPRFELRQRRHDWQKQVVEVLDLADPSREGFDYPQAEQKHEALEGVYTTLKQALLRAGTAGEVAIPEMERQLRIISETRRLVQQAMKAAKRMEGLLALARHNGGELQSTAHAEEKPPEESKPEI
ncbi:MAG: Na/Pi cotransporter family protein, partial [Chromatiales bacterium]|nr:Na/Pi cotransporter family protein [Chromatiales bacterium]